jgi:hypothetical protein
MLKELQTLFLHCIFNQPEYLKREISKHLEIPEDEIKITKEKENVDDNGNTIYSIYTVSIGGRNYTTRFDKKVRNAEKVKVPKLVKKKKEKKWWQIDNDELEVVVEENETKEMQYWVLSNIEC